MPWLIHKSIFTVVFLVTSLVAAPSLVSAKELPVVSVVKQQLPTERILDGKLEAVHQATVSSQTRGRVIKLHVDVGDYVSKGDPLIRFRAKDQQAQFDAAKAGHKEAVAEFDRIKEVYARKVVAKAAMDRVEVKLKSAKARLDQATEVLENTIIRAPYNGIVVKRHIEKGELANVGQKLITGLSLESLRAIVEVPQSNIHSVREHKQARVDLPNGQSLMANKITISPQASDISHTFTVRVNLPKGDYRVFPGMFVKVAFIVGTESQLVIPKQAVAYRGEVSAAYIQSADGTLSMQQIVLGRHVEDKIIVLSGLGEGDVVALDPVQAAIQVKTTRSAK